MAKNLRKLRIELGIIQQALADMIGISQQSINKYENHNVEPDIMTLIRLADFFNTSVDYLIGNCKEERNHKDFNIPVLSHEEMSVIRSYRKPNNKEKDSIHLILENYLSNK